MKQMETTKAGPGKLPWQASSTMKLLKVESVNPVTPP